MKQNTNVFESISSFRKGANAQGVRAELPAGSVPSQIKYLLNTK